MPDRVISKSIAFLKARSNFVVDLNNDMTSVVLDERGSTKTAISLSTVVRAFYGTRNVIGDCTVTAVSEDPDMNVTYDSTNNTVNIDISADTDLYDTTTITITVVHASYGTRTTTFTIVAVKEGDGAFIQELLPSLSDISFKRTIAGALDPTSRTLSLSIKKTEGGTTEEQTISDSDLYVRWSTSSMPSSRDAGTAWGSGTVTGITWSSGSMVIANSVDVSNIYIAAFKADNTLVDMETIPVIKDGEHGDAAPYYFQEWFAWSNVESTVNATTSPFGNNTEPNPAWNTSIPENTGWLVYLWRKSVRYVWDSSNRSYSTERAQYFRMSGTNGTSISVKDTVATVADLSNITNPQDGDAYVVSANGHLYMWSSEASNWIDLGQFKGDNGVTYYTHIAWATEVTLESSELPIPAGQANRPNALAANISGFSITPLSGVSYAWMGYLIDTNSFDSQTKQNYTWQRNKGEKGNDASEVNPNILLRTIFDNGIDFVKEQWSSNWSGTSIDTATDAIVEGRKSIRINAGMLSTNEFIDFQQNLYGKLKPSTWYTLSFNSFSTHNFSTFLWGGDNTPLVIDRSAGFYQDGTFIAEPPIDGNAQWEADWTGARHTLTFKTIDTFPSEYFWIMFRTYHIDGTTDRAQLVLCMPKLEIGEVATAYMANEDDLRGEKGDQGDKGDDAPIAFADPDKISVQCKNDGNVKSSITRTVTFTLKVGNTTYRNFTSISWSTPLPTGVTVTRTGANTVSITIGTTATSDGIAAGITFSITAYTGVGTVSAPVNIALIGALQGKDATYVYMKGTAISNDGSGTTELPLVKVNGGGNLVTACGRGLNLVTLSRQTLAKVESITYDTYGEASGESGATGITDLVTKLNSLNSSVFVCLVSYDAIGWSSTLIEALQGYGMGELPYTAAWRYPFLFFGYRGLGRGNGITRMNNATSPAENVEASVYVANGALTQPEAKRGKTGRFYYYSGYDWNANDNTHQFVVNDTQVPYFSKAGSSSDKHYVFNPEVMPASGYMTMAQMAAATTVSNAINWNDKPWEVMTDDFKYLITEVIFASTAHFGSAIINGDWMMSCFGIIYDASGGSHVIDSKNASWTSGGVTYNYANAYTLFDADYPNSSKPSALNFVPYYCVDMLAGAVYQQNAFVKGTIEATEGHIGGFIINSTQIKSLNNSIVLNSDGSAVIANGTFTGAINGQVVICGNANQEGKIYIQPDVYIEEEPGSGIHTAKLRGEFGTLNVHSFEIFATQDYAEFNLASSNNELNLTEKTLRIDTTSVVNSITHSKGVLVRVGDYTDNVTLQFYNRDGGSSLPISTTQQPPIGVSVGQVYVYQDASGSGQLRIKL